MGRKKPSYEELEAGLAAAETMLNALRDGKVDAVVGKGGVYLLRLKEMEEMLAQSQARIEEMEFTLDTLMECVPEGITMASFPDVRILRVSRYGRELLRKKNEELEDIPVEEHSAKWNIYARDGSTKAKNEDLPLTRAVQQGEIVKDEEWVLGTTDGRRIPVLCNAAPIRNRAGKIIGGIIAWRDITERKNAEAALRLLNETLEQRIRERTIDLRKRTEQLARLSSQLTLAEQRERSRIAEILHDHIQQLMVGAKMGLEVLMYQADNDLKPAVESILDLVNQSIKASRSLTVDLSPPVLRSGDLSTCLEWLAQWMHETHGCEVEVRTKGRFVLHRKDFAVLLFQSLKELLFNVVKHAGTKSACIDMTWDPEKRLRISVVDRGCGFDPDTIRENAPGDTGFGLIKIRERMAFMGGSLEVESSPGSGACLSLIVPLEALSKRDERRIGKNKDGLLRVETPGEKIRVLIADDHADVRQRFSAMLNRHSDIEVVGEAADGETAVRMSRKLEPDVVLMDINMPNMNGLEATRIIRSEFPGIRIIGLSMFDSDEAPAMIEAGASAYHSKSEDSDLLIDKIRGADLSGRYSFSDAS